jgi:chorismate dehydratase
VSPWLALHGLRIGCVQYLNSKPLIHGYDGEVRLAHPSELARELAAGRLDAALVPIFEVLREPRYTLVDDVAIASDGPVQSVLLGYRGELRDIHRVALDPASLTSANLLRVLLREFHGLAPDFGAEGEAQLLIGNQAIEFRDRASGDPTLRILDLGEEWRGCTGLPFVYAAWALRPGLPELRKIADGFRALKGHGLNCREEIIASDSTSTPAFRRRYLTEHIRFDLGEREKAGLQHFRELLHKHGQIRDADTPLTFV